MTKYQILMAKYQRLFTNDYQISTNSYVRIYKQIMQNKPKVKYAKINVNSYIIRKYVQVRHLVIQTNKPKQTQFKPKQTQFKPNCFKGQKLIQSMYLQRIMKKTRIWAMEKQSQNKPNLCHA